MHHMSLARAWTQTAQSGGKRTNHSTTMPELLNIMGEDWKSTRSTHYILIVSMISLEVQSVINKGLRIVTKYSLTVHLWLDAAV